MIVAGGVIGAGMFSLPTISSGMWFGWSLAMMLLTWFSLYLVAMMVLEVNLKYREGASFDTMVTDTLGPKWNLLNGLLLAFLLYIFEYAFISGGGSIISRTIQSTLGFSPPQLLAGLIFALSLSFIVWLSTRAVDRIITVMIAGMLVSFLMVVADLSPFVEVGKLLDSNSSDSRYSRFALATLPYYLASFACYPLVPSLVKYYGKKPALIDRSILFGTLISFALYLSWLVVTMGNLGREAFLTIAAEGGNIGVLVGALALAVASDNLGDLLDLFANMAVISSFLAVSLSLFDFIADKFKFDDTPRGRFKTALAVFVPPSAGGLFYPDGFIYAIGYAGLVLSVTALIIPPLMLQKSRRKFAADGYRLRGGNAPVCFALAMGIISGACHILAMLELLPVYGK